MSCPNVEDRSRMFAHSADATSRVMAATACGLPRWAKLSPNVPDVVEIAAGRPRGRGRRPDPGQHLARPGPRHRIRAGPSSGPAGAACRGPPCTRWRCGPCGSAAPPSPRRPSSGWAASCRGATPSSCCRPAPTPSRWAPRPSGTRGALEGAAPAGPLVRRPRHDGRRRSGSAGRRRGGADAAASERRGAAVAPRRNELEPGGRPGWLTASGTRWRPRCAPDGPLCAGIDPSSRAAGVVGPRATTPRVCASSAGPASRGSPGPWASSSPRSPSSSGTGRRAWPSSSASSPRRHAAGLHRHRRRQAGRHRLDRGRLRRRLARGRQPAGGRRRDGAPVPRPRSAGATLRPAAATGARRPGRRSQLQPGGPGAAAGGHRRGSQRRGHAARRDRRAQRLARHPPPGRWVR